MWYLKFLQKYGNIAENKWYQKLLAFATETKGITIRMPKRRYPKLTYSVSQFWVSRGLFNRRGSESPTRFAHPLGRNAALGLFTG